MERDETARQVSLQHVAQLMQRYPELLPRCRDFHVNKRGIMNVINYINNLPISIFSFNIEIIL